MLRLLFLVLVTGVFTTTAYAQDVSLYQKHLLVNKNDTLPYRLLLPKNYDATKKYPLLMVLHGSGERGNDNEAQLVHGAKTFLQNEFRNKYAAIIVFPQCSQNSYWSNVDIKQDSTGKPNFVFNANGAPTVAMKLAQQLLFQLIKQYAVNTKQVYIGGLSMGGMGTFEIVRRNPLTFAAAFPICGGANPATAQQLSKVKWWVFHGAKDDVVPAQKSIAMVAALKKVNASVKFTLYPEANHNSWDAAFANPALFAWLFAQKK
jgi:predicted peptidase